MRLSSLILLLLLSACRFDFDRELEPGELRGRVVLEDESRTRVGAAGALVRLEGSGVTVRADSAGRFALRRLPQGSYTLRIEHDSNSGLRLRDVRLEDARDIGELVIGGLGSLGGTLSRGNVPVEGRVVLEHVRQTPAPGGEWNFSQLVPGTYEVFVTDAEGLLYAAPSVEVKPRQALKLDLDLASLELLTTGSLQGNVRLVDARDHSGSEVLLAGSSLPAFLTGSGGFFAEAGIPAGVYTALASSPGYRSHALSNVVVHSNARLPDVVLIPQGDTCELGNLPASDTDRDADGVEDAEEPEVCLCDPGSTDLNEDGICDDPDQDGDGVPGHEDNCPLDFNPGQEDSDSNGVGDACESVDALCTGAACVDWPKKQPGQIAEIVKLPGSEKILVVYDTQVVIETDGSSWKKLPLPLEVLEAIGNSSLQLSAASETEAWILGPRGQLFERRGESWKAMNEADGELPDWFPHFEAFSRDDMVFGDDSGLYRWNGSGIEALPADTSGVYSVRGTSSSNLWISDGHGLHHFNGTQTTALSIDGRVLDYWIASDGTLWILEEVSGNEYELHVRRVVGGEAQAPSLIHPASYNFSVFPGLFDGEGLHPALALPSEEGVTLYRFDGVSWQQQLYDPGVDSFEVTLQARIVQQLATSSSHWLLNGNGRLERVEGTLRQHVAGDASFGFRALAVVSPSEVFALAGVRTLHRWDGSAWTEYQDAGPRVVDIAAGGGRLYGISSDLKLKVWNDDGWLSVVDDFGLDSANCTEYIGAPRLHVAGADDVWLSAATFNGVDCENALIRIENGTPTTLYGGMHPVGMFSGPTSNFWHVAEGEFRRFDDNRQLFTLIDNQMESELPLLQSLHALWAGSEAVYVLGLDHDSITALHARSADATWSSLHLDSHSGGGALWGASDNAVFACSWDGDFHHLNGTELTPLPSLGSVCIDLSGTSAQDVWAASPNRIQRYDGTRWTESIASPEPPTLAAVHGFSTTGAVTVDQQGAVFLRNETSGDWQFIGQPIQSGDSFFDPQLLVHAVSADQVWLVQATSQANEWARWHQGQWQTGILASDAFPTAFWASADGSEIFLHSSHAVLRWNGSDFENVTPMGGNLQIAGLGGTDIASLRLAGLYEIYSWTGSAFALDPVLGVGYPFEPRSFVAKSSGESFLATATDLYEFSDGEWKQLSVSFSKAAQPPFEFHALALSGEELWVSYQHKLSPEHSGVGRRSASGIWSWHPAPLPNYALESFSAAGGVGWGLQLNSVIRVAP